MLKFEHRLIQLTVAKVYAICIMHDYCIFVSTWEFKIKVILIQYYKTMI